MIGPAQSDDAAVVASGQPEARPGDERTPVPEGTCTCFCLKRWVSPLANPDVPHAGFPKFVGGWRQRVEVELEQGDVYWNAEINKKDYDCNTKAVSAVTMIADTLVKERYMQFRWRVLIITTITIFGIPIPTSIAWGPWSLWFRTITPMNEKDQLASGGYAPWCPDDGVPCP